MAVSRGQAVWNDLWTAAQLTFRHSRHQLVQAWLYVPAGILVMLLACFGVEKLFALRSVPFPASVACLVILVAALLLAERLLGENRTRRVVAVIEVPGGWALRWINVLFTPSFVLLPLSPAIGGIEVLKIIAVFVIGFVVMIAFAAYLTRGLQLVLGSSKRAVAERAEELHPGSADAIPLAAAAPPPPADGSASGSATAVDDDDAPSSDDARVVRPPPASRGRGAASDAGRGDDDPARAAAELPPQAPVPPARATRWAARMAAHLDAAPYAAALVLAGLPAYYGAGYAMPLHASVNVLAYAGAAALPAAWQRVLHPVLVASLATVLALWALGLARGQPLAATLAAYKTGAGYQELWGGRRGRDAALPGAADLFASVLDASIVSFALPVYRYRRELRRHLLPILVPNVAISVGSLFAYPWVCRAVGIAARRGLAFAARSLTLALAVPAATNLGGDVNTAAALAIMSGIVGVLVGRRMLAWLKIPEDDYVTRGVTLGANSSAIAAALLLRTDPRAAALSILSMSLFGTITVLFTSIPPITAAVQSLVGL
ncbi:LrgB-like family-domain-containing protein [Durotheca rogersii]|uniref:LrgB-like family-domain-containing protein n=1 Tax=Durotheca rogersii TaxID=419775 RepID=UPI00221FFBF1|nr:LrgB-like family-domain-containing protein [Durotheca rogersii]KAI5863787.1 LrgB-like family-domain-containing protein [Durotheca rogersii]